jgi:membrane protease YdiL (CAAX protease family)
VNWIKRHPLIAFFGLSYALSWWPWVWTAIDPTAPSTILPPGPLIAALIVLAITGGWGAIRQFLGRIAQWRVGVHWYAIVLGLPVVITAASAALNLAFGAQMAPHFAGWTDLGGRFAFILLLIGLGEEPAWRGFALPRLMVGRSALAASLILGLLHIVWHLPLLGVEYDAGNVVPWMVGVVAFAILVTWIYLHTEGSLLLPMLFHTSVNVSAVAFGWFSDDDLLRLWWLFGALWALAALLVIMRNGPALRFASAIPSGGKQSHANARTADG